MNKPRHQTPSALAAWITLLAIVAAVALVLAGWYHRAGAAEPVSVTVTMSDGTTRSFPATQRTPDVVTLPPAITRLVADPLSKARGVGRVLTGDAGPLQVDGYATNLVLDTAGPATLRGVISADAWRDDQPVGMPVRDEWGHGLYVYRSAGVTIDGCYFGRDGWQPGKPDAEKNPKRHGVYNGDPAGALNVVRSIFDRNAACGVQHRGTGDGLIDGCVFFENATGVLGKQKSGTLTITRCVFIGRDWTLQVDQNGKQVWADGNGVTVYGPTVIRDCLFVGRKKATADDGRKRNPGAWLAVGIDPATGKPATVDQSGNRVVQWTGPGIDYDPTPILDAVADGKVNVADAIGRIRADVLKLAVN